MAPTSLSQYSFQSPWAPVVGGQTARVDIYRQGATVTADTPITSGSSVAVPVFNLGAIAVGDSVRVGTMGPVFSVTAITPPPSASVTLHNTGSTYTVPAGSRLVDLSARPAVYADPNGVTALNYPLIGDSTGEVSAYLLDGLYDAMLVGNPPTPDTASTDLFSSASGPSTSWNHTVVGQHGFLVVGVSWQDVLNSESITGITYQTTVSGVTTTQNLTQVLSSGLLSIYVLSDPIPATGLITVTWNGSNAKGAVCGAVCFSLVDLVAPVGASTISSLNTIHPDVTLTTKFPYGTTFDVLALNAIASTTTAWNLSGVQIWSGNAGSGGGTRTQGAAAVRPSGIPPVDVAWALAASKSWALGAIELIPSQVRLLTDVGSSTGCCGSMGLNAQDFGSLTDAIDALGPRGGTVYLPNGNYVLSSGIVIDRDQITLVGESQNAIIQPIAPDLFDLITVNASYFRMRNLTVDGKGTAQDQTVSGKSCVVLNGLGAAGRLVLGSTFENVSFTGAPRYGLFAHDAIVATFIDCEFNANWYDGARLETLTTGCVALRFIGCLFTNNYGRGLSVKNCTALLLDGCGGEGNSRDSTTGTGRFDASGVFVESLGVGVTISACDFEGAAAAVENLVFFTDSYSCDISATKFSGSGYGTTANRGFRTNTGCQGITLRACAFSGFQATADSPSVPAGAVAAILSPNCVSIANYIEPTGGPAQFIFVADNSIAMFGGRNMSAYATAAALPAASTVEPGTSVYVASPANVQVSDGAVWQSIGGGVVRVFMNDGARPAASSVAIGTLIYVQSPGTPAQKLQIGDGSSWIGIA